MLATVSAQRHPVDDAGSDDIIDRYTANVASASDYYPFGSIMPGRSVFSDKYQFGHQGQLKEDEVAGSGANYLYLYRMYDARVCRFWSVDPLAGRYPYWSPYSFSGNRLIDMVEFEGMEPTHQGQEGEIAKDPENPEGSDFISQGGQWTRIEGVLPEVDILPSSPLVGKSLEIPSEPWGTFEGPYDPVMLGNEYWNLDWNFKLPSRDQESGLVETVDEAKGQCPTKAKGAGATQIDVGDVVTAFGALGFSLPQGPVELFEIFKLLFDLFFEVKEMKEDSGTPPKVTTEIDVKEEVQEKDLNKTDTTIDKLILKPGKGRHSQIPVDTQKIIVPVEEGREYLHWGDEGDSTTFKRKK
ncbi:MAG: hypothetical protein KJ607_06500 [Bacteroidetes bacterium]|nr:hypothetical protein [Bacteroidota bacterium]